LLVQWQERRSVLEKLGWGTQLECLLPVCILFAPSILYLKGNPNMVDVILLVDQLLAHTLVEGTKLLSSQTQNLDN